MRKSLLSFFHLALASCAAALAPVLPWRPESVLRYGSLTPGIGDPPKVNPPRRYRRRRDAPAVSLFVGMIRHHTSAQFARFFDNRQKRRASGWMVVA